MNLDISEQISRGLQEDFRKYEEQCERELTEWYERSKLDQFKVMGIGPGITHKLKWIYDENGKIIDSEIIHDTGDLIKQIALEDK